MVTAIASACDSIRVRAPIRMRVAVPLLEFRALRNCPVVRLNQPRIAANNRHTETDFGAENCEVIEDASMRLNLAIGPVRSALCLDGRKVPVSRIEPSRSALELFLPNVTFQPKREFLRSLATGLLLVRPPHSSRCVRVSAE